MAEWLQSSSWCVYSFSFPAFCRFTVIRRQKVWAAPSSRSFVVVVAEQRSVYMFVQTWYLFIWREWRFSASHLFPLDPSSPAKCVVLQKRSWLLFNITAYSLHLATTLTFCLELNFSHYVFFLPRVFKFRHPEAFRYRSLQLLSLYSLCSRRPYGGRLVYYLSISSAGVVGLCLATTAAGHAEFNWNHVGLGGKREERLCLFSGEVIASLHLRCPLLESL